MAHWIAVVPNKLSTACKTKEEAIWEISLLFTGNSRHMASIVDRQLHSSKGASIAYGVEGEEIAKVLPCNCGSLKVHIK